MEKLTKFCLILRKEFTRSESDCGKFWRIWYLVTQVKVSSQTTVLANQALKIKDQYEYPVKLVETIKSAKYTIEKAVQAIQELDVEKTLAALTVTSRKRMHNNGIYKIMNMKRPDISLAVYSLLQHA